MATEPGPAAWDDSLADSLALIEACRFEDTEGFRCVIRNLDHTERGAVICTMAKLLAELADEHQSRPDTFRRWAIAAQERS